MAVQGIWSGTISFSLVAIPVRLVRAIEPGRVSFRLLHSRDFSTPGKENVLSGRRDHGARGGDHPGIRNRPRSIHPDDRRGNWSR